MKKTEKEEVIDLYESRLKKYGRNVKTVGWKDEEQQILRFKILADIGKLKNATILDVGCGFGDFYNYLKYTEIKDYTGFDISPKILEIARKEYPGLKFAVKDILTDEIEETFDYVFASGILNKRISNNMNYAKKIIKKMYDLCNVGVGINMMTKYVDYEEDYLYYYDPEKIFKYCKGLSKYVTLRHDYPLYEFTVYVYRKKRYDYPKIKHRE